MVPFRRRPCTIHNADRGPSQSWCPQRWSLVTFRFDAARLSTHWTLVAGSTRSVGPYKGVNVGVHVRLLKRAQSANLSYPPTTRKPPELHGFREVPGVPGGLAKQALSQLSYGPVVLLDRAPRNARASGNDA